MDQRICVNCGSVVPPDFKESCRTCWLPWDRLDPNVHGDLERLSPAARARIDALLEPGEHIEAVLAGPRSEIVGTDRRIIVRKTVTTTSYPYERLDAVEVVVRFMNYYVILRGEGLARTVPFWQMAGDRGAHVVTITTRNIKSARLAAAILTRRIIAARAAVQGPAVTRSP